MNWQFYYLTMYELIFWLWMFLALIPPYFDSKSLLRKLSTLIIEKDPLRIPLKVSNKFNMTFPPSRSVICKLWWKNNKTISIIQKISFALYAGNCRKDDRNCHMHIGILSYVTQFPMRGENYVIKIVYDPIFEAIHF